MSINLPVIDLSTAAVGTSGKISIKPQGILNPTGTDVDGHMYLFNESGSGLQLDFSDGKGTSLPAGGWQIYELSPTVTEIKWTVLYRLPNPPVTSLIPVYYFPGEKVPDNAILGNSPIGIGGVVNTSVTTLSNEGNASQTLVIDIGQVGHTLLITINSDGSFTFSVLQSGVVHQVLKSQTSGNPLLIGQASDISEVLGNILVDGGVTVLTGAKGNIHVGQLVTGDTIDTDSNAQLYLKAPTGQGVVFQINGVTLASVNGNGVNFVQGTIKRLSSANGTSCGSGTVINHGLSTNFNPQVVATPNIAQPGSATVGVGSIGTTSFTATVGSGSAIDWISFTTAGT